MLFNRISKRYQLFLGNNYDGVPSVIQYSSSSPQGPWQFDYPIYQAPYLDATTIECPNKFYAVDKATGEQTVGLVFSINAIKADTSIALYVVGKEDQEGRFYNTTDIRRVDHGGHFYATQLFAGATQKTYAITWMQDWNK